MNVLRNCLKKKWKQKEIDNGSVDLGYQTAYYCINYITLLLKSAISITTKGKDIKRFDFKNLIEEMNEVISIFQYFYLSFFNFHFR